MSTNNSTTPSQEDQFLKCKNWELRSKMMLVVDKNGYEDLNYKTHNDEAKRLRILYPEAYEELILCKISK